eukprot:jgi/Chlat1/1814/Chrsp135S02135
MAVTMTNSAATSLLRGAAATSQYAAAAEQQPARPARERPAAAAAARSSFLGKAAVTGSRLAASSWSSSLARRRTTVVEASSAAASSSSSSLLDGFPTLQDLPLVPFIDAEGKVASPPAAEGVTAAAWVFAVHDKNKKVQYIGFCGADARNALRKLLARRPALCYYFKSAPLTAIDQKALVEARNKWASELGVLPKGNTDQSERKQWEAPVDAGAVSERGKAAAAASTAKQLSDALAERGYKEAVVWDPELLAKGQVDILANVEEERSDEEKDAAAARVAEAVAKQRHVNITIGERNIEYDITYQRKFPTKGGWMIDLMLSYDGSDTTHRVICSKNSVERYQTSPEEIIETAFALFMAKRMPRKTEGLLASGVFPVNYFTISEVEQWFDDFPKMFNVTTPARDRWGFNRLHTYGTQAEGSPLLGPGANST